MLYCLLFLSTASSFKARAQCGNMRLFTAGRESGTVELPEEAQPKWQDRDVMFGSKSQMNRHMHRTLSGKEMTDKANMEEQKGEAQVLRMN